MGKDLGIDFFVLGLSISNLESIKTQLDEIKEIKNISSKNCTKYSNQMIEIAERCIYMKSKIIELENSIIKNIRNYSIKIWQKEVEEYAEKFKEKN